MIKTYEEEYLDNFKKYRKAKAEMQVSSDKKLEQAFKDMQFYSKEAKGSYEQFSLSVKELDFSEQLPFQRKVNEFSNQVELMRKEVNKAQRDYGFIKNKENLYGSHWNEHSDTESYQSQRLLGENTPLSDQHNKLNQVIRVGHETEVIAQDTKFNLAKDTEKMQRIRDNIGRVDDEMTISDKLIDIIRRNESRNRFILYSVAFVIVAAILIMLFAKIFKR
ncbi:unnamed protein product [Moneuplotes crassus]|uniref:t-SNARE coiled-coil homology domain-containing protein n=1 Tax=Euplotes crassus TaxID=5936 RepID=A0AAD1XPZ5_EUPCR|nr:unnamed protein product [Moneuplotes crassus]